MPLLTRSRSSQELSPSEQAPQPSAHRKSGRISDQSVDGGQGADGQDDIDQDELEVDSLAGLPSAAIAEALAAPPPGQGPVRRSSRLRSPENRQAGPSNSSRTRATRPVATAAANGEGSGNRTGTPNNSAHVPVVDLTAPSPPLPRPTVSRSRTSSRASSVASGSASGSGSRTSSSRSGARLAEVLPNGLMLPLGADSIARVAATHIPAAAARRHGTRLAASIARSEQARSRTLRAGRSRGSAAIAPEHVVVLSDDSDEEQPPNRRSELLPLVADVRSPPPMALPPAMPHSHRSPRGNEGNSSGSARHVRPLPMPTRSPPRQGPLPEQHPLFSTYNCPICLCPPSQVCATPCGHVFCGECLFGALRTQAQQREAAAREREALFAPALAPFGLHAAALGGANVANVAGIGHIYALLRARADALGVLGGAPEPPAPGDGAAGGPGAGVRPLGGRGPAQGPAGRRRGQQEDPLAGHCPVCRADIKGGFSGVAGRGVIGLELMLGVPVDDPREPEGQPAKGAGWKKVGVVTEEQDDETRSTQDDDLDVDHHPGCDCVQKRNRKRQSPAGGEAQGPARPKPYKRRRT